MEKRNEKFKMKKKEELAYSRALVPRKGNLYKKITICICFGLIILLVILFTHKCKSIENVFVSGDSAEIVERIYRTGIDTKKEVGRDTMEIDYIDNLTCSISYPEIGIKIIDNQIKMIVTGLKEKFMIKYKDSVSEKATFFQYIDYETYFSSESTMKLIFIEDLVVNDSSIANENVFIYVFNLENGEIMEKYELSKDEYLTTNEEEEERIPIKNEVEGSSPVKLNIEKRGIDPKKPMVAITYDDGPNAVSTPRILDTLEKYNVVATFFDLGQLVNNYPEIVRREELLKCEVGNHTYSHANLNILSEEELRDEISKSEMAFEKALGHKPLLLRPAYGNANAKVREYVDYPLITWSIDSLDWKSRNKDAILQEIRNVKNFDGKIILLHSIYESTAEATEVLIPELIENGYQLVTVSELAYYKGKSLEIGKIYTSF